MPTCITASLRQERKKPAEGWQQALSAGKPGSDLCRFRQDRPGSRRKEDGLMDGMEKIAIITIEREYASGGSEIGKRVSQRLGIPVYGHEIVEMAAKRGNTTPEYIEHLEETDTNSLLYSLLMMAKTAVGQPAQISGNDALNLLEARIIEEMARRGRCVIVGRCAGWILRDRRDVLNVFIHADEETRIKRAVEVYGVPEGQAAATLRQFDRRRANFYHANTNLAWKEKDGYHMVLDSGKLGIGACADLIAHLVERSRAA